METSEVLVTPLTHWSVLEGDKEPADTQPFELYLAMQVCYQINNNKTTILIFSNNYNFRSSLL